MRLSDLLDKGRRNLDKTPSPNATPEESSRKENYRARSLTIPSVMAPPVKTSYTNADKSGHKPDDKPMYDGAPDAIYKAAEKLEIPIPHNKKLTIQKAKTALANIFSKALDPTTDKNGLWEQTRKISSDISAILALDSNFAQMIQYDKNDDNRLITHSINACILSIDIAREFEKAEYSPLEIGSAALLHDIGISALGLDIIWDETNPIFKLHVARSVEILETLKTPEIIKTVVAQHHERINGGGYPAGISGSEFLISSQILSLAEGFERIMGKSFENNSNGMPDHNYIQATLNEYHNAFDQNLMKSFISLRGFYPNGIMVELTNRSICLVLKQNEGFPLRPVVQLVLDSSGNHPDEPKIIDLRLNNTLSVIRAITQQPEMKQK